MSGLYGALFSSVAGLSAQSSAIAADSDNISNVNTVGYKNNETIFQTLVTSASGTAFSSGGVLSQTESLIDQQGQIQATSSPTDLAISGDGFFVVNSQASGNGNISYTRAGSFTQDSLGNFVNSAGYYLQGWPLDRNGDLPGAPGNTTDTTSANNLSSLETVNVESATGTAAETTTVALSANLDSSQSIYPGAADTAGMDSLTVNSNQPATSIIIPDVLDGTAQSGDIDNIQRGDTFNITTGSGGSFTYTYGGFTYSRDVTSTDSVGDSGTPTQLNPLTLNSTPFTINNTSTVTVNAANSGLVAGDVVTITGNTADVGTASGTDFDGEFIVQSANANGFTITVPGAAGAGSTTGGSATGVSVVTRPFAGNILDATTASATLLGVTGTTGFSAPALTFTITTASAGTNTFTYTSSAPNDQLGQFNTLDNLATAINATSGLAARVSNGRLYVSSTNPDEAVTFANGDATATTSGSNILAGIDWVGELGLQNISASTNTFNSLQSLATQINSSTALAATVNNPLTDSTLSINVDDPLDTISFADPATVAPVPLATATPITTVSGSNLVTINGAGLGNLTAGQVVTLDPTSMAGYPSPLTSGDTFSTTSGSNSITINMANSYAVGDQVYLDPTKMAGYPSATIDGVPITDLSGLFTLQAGTTGTKIVINVASQATSTNAGSPAATGLVVSPTFNGIPITALNGEFVVQSVSGPSTFNIEVPEEANATGPTGETGLIVTPPTNSGSLLAELGLGASLNGAGYTPESVGPLGPEYDPTNSAKNMAGGDISPQFTQNIQVFDSLGAAHNLTVGFIKTGVNTWAAEIYDTTSNDVAATYANGLIASGTITFNGDGSLRSVSSGLSTPIGIAWADQSLDSTISINWGTAGVPGTGKTDGMTQFDSDYAVNFVNQNGNAVGQLTGVSVTTAGIVVANFSNGQSQDLFQIPLAVFGAPDSLQAASGNVYTQTQGSGDPNLREAGTSSAGTIQPSALETSTVDLATELTNLIVAQNAYSANAKVISVVDTLEQDLDNTIQG